MFKKTQDLLCCLNSIKTKKLEYHLALFNAICIIFYLVGLASIPWVLIDRIYILLFILGFIFLFFSVFLNIFCIKTRKKDLINFELNHISYSLSLIMIIISAINIFLNCLISYGVLYTLKNINKSKKLPSTTQNSSGEKIGGGFTSALVSVVGVFISWIGIFIFWVADNIRIKAKTDDSYNNYLRIKNFQKYYTFNNSSSYNNYNHGDDNNSNNNKIIITSNQEDNNNININNNKRNTNNNLNSKAIINLSKNSSSTSLSNSNNNDHSISNYNNIYNNESFDDNIKMNLKSYDSNKAKVIENLNNVNININILKNISNSNSNSELSEIKDDDSSSHSSTNRVKIIGNQRAEYVKIIGIDEQGNPIYTRQNQSNPNEKSRSSESDSSSSGKISSENVLLKPNESSFNLSTSLENIGSNIMNTINSITDSFGGKDNNNSSIHEQIGIGINHIIGNSNNNSININLNSFDNSENFKSFGNDSIDFQDNFIDIVDNSNEKKEISITDNKSIKSNKSDNNKSENSKNKSFNKENEKKNEIDNNSDNDNEEDGEGEGNIRGDKGNKIEILDENEDEEEKNNESGKKIGIDKCDQKNNKAAEIK